MGAVGPGAGPVCRGCGAVLRRTFVDLGPSPLCERFLAANELDDMEPFYPLHVRICDACLLVQLPAYVPGEEIFSEYAYFSSYADSWVAHAAAYVALMVDRLALGPASRVVEIASNDGYLLQHVVARGIPALGVESAANVARAARARGVPTVEHFFGAAVAAALVADGGTADLVVANNVLAHVPDIRDFTRGLAVLLAPGGTLTLEFPHLLRLIEGVQFDTIYHEHYSYLSLFTVGRLLREQGLVMTDVEELPTHGGSLRVHARHAAVAAPTPRVAAVAAAEAAFGLDGPDGYAGFGPRVEAVKRALLTFLIEARDAGKTVAGYGAPGKGNTLLNYCGIRGDLLAYTVDRNPYKHDRFLPGTRIPVFAPARLAETRPDYILILPWNLRDEIAAQLAYTRDWGARFVVPIPTVEIF